MDSEKGNRVFARGAQCAPPPPPWFLEPKKSLVWIGLKKKTDSLFTGKPLTATNCCSFCRPPECNEGTAEGTGAGKTAERYSMPK